MIEEMNCYKVKTYTKTGEYHTNNRTENQDAVIHAENEEFKIIALADGVSSCENGKAGAEIACRTVRDIFLSCGEIFFAYPHEQTAYLILAEIVRNLSAAAKQNNASVASYSSTLCLVCLEKRTGRVFTFQLGDSNIFFLSSSGFRAINAKKFNNLCFTTYPDADEQTCIGVFETKNIDGIMICSDGAWQLLYDKNALEPDVLKSIQASDFDFFADYFESRHNPDDCSYAILNLKR